MIGGACKLEFVHSLSMKGSVDQSFPRSALSFKVKLKGLGCVWVVGHLLSMRKALGSIPRTISETESGKMDL